MGAKDIEKHQFKKGQSGNPKGAPKKIPNLDVHIAKVLGGDLDDAEGLMEILTSMMKQAKKGNTRAAEILLDRAYGKAKQQIEQNVNVNKEFILERTVETKPKTD